TDRRETRGDETCTLLASDHRGPDQIIGPRVKNVSVVQRRPRDGAVRRGPSRPGGPASHAHAERDVGRDVGGGVLADAPLGTAGSLGDAGGGRGAIDL